MTRHTVTRTWRPCWNIPGAGLLFWLLVALLAACAPGSPGGPSSFPKGELHVLQVPTPYVLPGQMVRGPDGNLWFPAIAYANFATHQPSGAIGRLTPAGQFDLFPLPDLNSYPTAITLTSDGSVWFPVFQGNGQLGAGGDTLPQFTGGFSELGRMTAAGQVQLFPLPSPKVTLAGIAAGSDGNLWFAANADAYGAPSPRIGRMTPAGEVTSFPVPAPFAQSYLRQIIAGPDGNLWFSLEGADASDDILGALGKLTPQGALTFVPLGKDAVPVDITVGPDHNLWFTTDSEVGRVTRDGQVRLFDPDPQASLGDRLILDGITSGPDAALWFATGDREVGRVTPDGRFTFYPLPATTQFDISSSSLTLGLAHEIVTGADGGLWLTDGAQVGHFV